MNRNQIKAFFLSTTFLFYGLLPVQKVSAFSLPCDVTRDTPFASKKCKAKLYLSQSIPHYDRIAPYVVDEVRLVDFIKKYRKKYDKGQPLSEQEKLDIIVQLGIYKYAPKWLKPEIKAKIDAMMLKANSHINSLLTNSVKIAMVNGNDFTTHTHIVRDISLRGGVQISLNTGTISLLFELPAAGVGTAGVGTAGVAVGTLLIEIIVPVVLAAAIGAAIDYAVRLHDRELIAKEMEEDCHKPGIQCITIERKPKSVPVEREVQVGEGSGGNQRPPRDQCITAIKLLTQYKRLAEKYGIKLSNNRITEMNALRDTGTITVNNIPASLNRKFPIGTFGNMTLETIRKMCGMEMNIF
jgi:hypothetical protein